MRAVVAERMVVVRWILAPSMLISLHLVNQEVENLVETGAVDKREAAARRGTSIVMMQQVEAMKSRRGTASAVATGELKVKK
jgi:hypothetical protein